MRIKVLIMIIFTGSLICACNEKESGDDVFSNRTVYTYRIKYTKTKELELIDSSTVYIDTLTVNHKKQYNYRDPDNPEFLFLFPFSSKNDSLYIFDKVCNTIDTIPVDYNHETIIFFKSEYDDENIVDEESYIYWNTKYGLVSIYNYASGVLILIVPENSSAKKVFYNFMEKEIFQ